MLRPMSGPARDAALLVARVLLGVALFARGFQKVFGSGLGRAAAMFSNVGVPVPWGVCGVPISCSGCSTWAYVRAVLRSRPSRRAMALIASGLGPVRCRRQRHRHTRAIRAMVVGCG